MEKFATTNKKLTEWVNKMAKLCSPERIVWIDGSEEQKLVLEMMLPGPSI
jgi:GTP-dependent phosphoenolpyruvate carboxykinase